MPSFKKYLISSIAVHAVILLAMIITPGFAKKNYSFPEGYKVKMVSLPKGTMTAGRGKPAPEPSSTKPDSAESEIQKPVPLAPEAKAPPKKPGPISMETDKIPTEDEKTSAVPDQSAVENDPSGTTGNSNGGSDSGTGQGIPGLETGDAGVVAHLDTEDFEYLWYLENIQRKLSSNWVKPSWTGNDGNSSVIIYFQVLSDGKIINAEVKESSGISSTDRACLRAVIASSPLPPLPRGFRENKLGVHFRFII